MQIVVEQKQRIFYWGQLLKFFSEFKPVQKPENETKREDAAASDLLSIPEREILSGGRNILDPQLGMDWLNSSDQSPESLDRVKRVVSKIVFFSVVYLRGAPLHFDKPQISAKLQHMCRKD